MQRPTVKIVQKQEETLNNDERSLSEEETKAYLYKNHPDLYKRMYPDTVVEKIPKRNTIPNQSQKRVNQDVQKSDKVYKYDRYDSADSEDGGFSYKIQITTDMNLNQ
tara:strand:+ start:10868 stop:11188 length:321 start_codon:yes stop_codon:yes gene_type:complete